MIKIYLEMWVKILQIWWPVIFSVIVGLAVLARLERREKNGKSKKKQYKIYQNGGNRMEINTHEKLLEMFIDTDKLHEFLKDRGYSKGKEHLIDALYFGIRETDLYLCEGNLS